MPEACKIVILSLFLRDSRLRSLVVDGNPGSPDVVCPIPRVGLLEERPAASGRREKTQRGELQCQVEDDTAEGLVVKTVWVNARVCPFRMIDNRKSETMISSSRDHEHLEVLLDSACVMAEDRESWMCGFSKGQWLIARDKECDNAQRCVNVCKLVNETITSNVQALIVVESDQEVKFDQDASITDVKNTLTGDFRSVGGSSSVSK